MKTTSSRAALSLVELLAALAVIGILFAMFLAVLGDLRARARSSACISNLRQVGIGLQLYLNEHGERFPEMAAARESADDPHPVLDTVLSPYLDDPLAFVCPADFRGVAAATGTSYYWNSALNGQRLGSLDFLTISDPARIPVVADKESFHRGTARPVNYLYADGHSRNELRLFTE